VFGGSHGDGYNFGSSSSQVFVGVGGADTINGGYGTVAPEIFVSGAERLVVTGSQPVTVVSLASGGVIDTSATAGNNVVFAGFGSVGNQTLIGSAPGIDAAGIPTHDTFVADADPAGVATVISIENWHSGDVFYLSGFTTADADVMDAAISDSLGHGASGDLSFTLGDKTTIAFVGSHPTNFTANAAF